MNRIPKLIGFEKIIPIDETSSLKKNQDAQNSPIRETIKSLFVRESPPALLLPPPFISYISSTKPTNAPRRSAKKGIQVCERLKNSNL